MKSHADQGRPGLSGAVGVALVWGVALIMAAAGVSKLLDLGAFRSHLDSWTLLPRSLVPVITMAVPMAELAFLVALLGRIGCLRIAQSLCLWRLLLTAAYGAQALAQPPVGCGCFGEILRFERSQDQAVWTLVRNGVLISAVGGGLLLHRRAVRA